MLGGLLTVLSISVFILIHEAGHFVAARATGMKATQFFLGFGPSLWSFRRGETEFGVKALPLGGYVRIVGMHDAEGVHPDDLSRSYVVQPFWKKSVVVLSGVVLNVVMGFLLILGVVWASGSYEPTTTIEHVVDEVTPGVPSPAAAAGLRVGDTIHTVGRAKVTGWNHAVSIIHAHPGQEILLGIARDGRAMLVTVRLADHHPRTGDAVGFLGVGPTRVRVPVGVFTAVGIAGRLEWSMGVATVEAIARILTPASLMELGGALFGNPDVPNDIRPVSPIGLVHLGAQAREYGIGSFVMVLAATNIALAIFNSLPLYPLDGGHFAVALYEKLTRRTVNVRRLIPVAVTVVILLAYLGLVAIVLDIVNPIQL